MKKIQDADVNGKKVILRVDFNVSLENGRAKETFKIKAAKESLQFLLSQNARVALMSYFGRPEGKVDAKFSMSQLVPDVAEVLGVKIRFVDDCIGPKVAEGMAALEEGEVLMLENARFYAGEDGNDEELAKKMAEGFDVFINDAFSQSHRDQASVTGITKFLPSYAGLQLQKEVEEMEKIKNDFAQPALAIIGGAKIETKLPVIKFFEHKYDFVLVGGKIANEALDQKIEFSEKVILPIDFSGDPVKLRHGAGRFDIGPRTIEKFKEIISSARTIVWNGPLGMFEKEEFAAGTYEILDAILENKEAYFVIGGGETLEALEKRQAMEKASFVSTGGGAMLTYLGGEKMPGILCLAD